MTRLTFEKSVRLFAAVGAIAVVVTSITVSTPALAKERPVVVAANPEVVTRRVTYADLNLASLPGEAALTARTRHSCNLRKLPLCDSVWQLSRCAKADRF